MCLRKLEDTKTIKWTQGGFQKTLKQNLGK
jgi:hypothetical protein